MRAPSWLGLFCYGETWEQLESWLEAASRHGFTEVQPAFGWANYGASDLKRLACALKRLNLRCRSFGVYCDIMKWDSPCQLPTTGETLLLVVREARVAGIESVVCWSGTYGDLMDEVPENRTAAARRALRDHILAALPFLREYKCRLLFEPWRTHVLHDEHVTAETCAIAPDALGSVFDPPNFIHPTEFECRSERLMEMLKILGPSLGLIHIKDMVVGPDGKWSLPMFGKGQMPHETILSALTPYLGKIPVIAEHLDGMDSIPELLEFIHRFSGRREV